MTFVKGYRRTTLNKRALKKMEAGRDIDAEILEAVAQIHRGEGTIVFQGTDCPYPVGTRLPISESCSDAERRDHASQMIDPTFANIEPYVPELVTGMNITRSGDKEGFVEQRKKSILPPLGGLNMLTDGVRTMFVDSVCLMVHDEDGKLLVVSRKDNHEDLGMPGGKIENDEDAYDAILRECAEELGVDYPREDLIVAYVGPCGDHTTACFTLLDARTSKGLVDCRIPVDKINDEGALVTRVDTLLDISIPGKSCFAEYNMAVWNHLNTMAEQANARSN